MSRKISGRKGDSFDVSITKRAKQFLKSVQELYPNAQTELANWTSPFQFLICIVLSSQTTDKQVNKVTAALFDKYPTATELAKAEISDVAKLISLVNFKNVKSKHIIEASKIIIHEFNGVVPKVLLDLMKLPGVGYKVANVFLNGLYKENQGIAVDTHVARVAQRMGLSKNSDPLKIAKDLERIFAKEDWYKINGAVVLFGRYVCIARNPKCDQCIMNEFCPKTTIEKKDEV